MDRADTSWRMAETACEHRDWEGADQWFRRALQDESPAPHIRIAYGAFLADRQEFRRAIDQLMQGLDSAQTAGDLDGQTAALSHLAAIYRQLGEYDLARRFQRRVLTLRGEADVDDLLAWSADALLAGKTSVAESLAQTVLSLAEESEDRNAQADALGMLGVIAARRGRHRQAVSLLVRAARGHQGLEDDRGLGADYANLAEVCGLIDRPAWQTAFFTAASRCFERAGMSRSRDQSERRRRATERHRRTESRWN